MPGFIYIKENAYHIEAPRKFDITSDRSLRRLFIISVDVPENKSKSQLPVEAKSKKFDSQKFLPRDSWPNL